MFYQQKSDLSIYLSLSSVLPCLFFEFLESDPFKLIILNDSYHFHYIDDILFIYPRNNDLTNITDRLNSIEPTIDLTYEPETNDILPFFEYFANK